MILKELIDVLDPKREGFIWILFKNEHSEPMCKANTASSFIIPLYERKVEFVSPKSKTEMDVYLEGEI